MLKTYWVAIVAMLSVSAFAEVQRIQLQGRDVSLTITPDIGGRVLAFSLNGQSNFLQVGPEVESNPNPNVSPMADNVGYMGHEIWVGPQNEWWTHQQVNPARAAAKADWPPDPFLILAKNKILFQDRHHLVMQGPDSPVSGVRLTKSYELVKGATKGATEAVRLKVRAENIRKDSVAWDIWFNTRTFSDTQIYVPVANEQEVRLKTIELANFASPVNMHFLSGFVGIDHQVVSGKLGSVGKVFIQPSHGWMAAFRGGQLMIIQFPLQPKAVIHPDQGQVELYTQYTYDKPNEGLLEMEVHAPYRQLRPGGVMDAQETWQIISYRGATTPEAQVAFLQQQARVLGLK